MKSARQKTESALVRQVRRLGAAVLAAYWIGLILTPANLTSVDAVRFMIGAIGVGAAFAAWGGGRALAEGVRVFGAAPFPARLWQDWLTSVVCRMLFTWIVAACAATVVLVFKPAIWVWYGPAVLYAGVVGAGLSVSLALHGVLKRTHGWLVAAVGVGAATLLVFYGADGALQFVQLNNTWSTVVLPACSLAVIFLLQSWYSTPPFGQTAARDATGCRSKGIPILVEATRWILLWARRYMLLQLGAYHSTKPVASGLFASFALIVLFAAPVNHGVPRYWGEPIGWFHVGTMAYAALIASANLYCRDMHWRWVLAPGGVASGTLGWQLILSTGKVFIALALIICAVVTILMMGFGWATPLGISGALRIIANGLRGCMFVPIQLLAAISLGAVLRGSPRPQIIYWVGTAALCALALAVALSKKMQVTFGVVGPGYLGALLLVTGASILIANRVWVQERLLRNYFDGAKTPTIHNLFKRRLFESD